MQQYLSFFKLLSTSTCIGFGFAQHRLLRRLSRQRFIGTEWYHWNTIQKIDANAASGGKALANQPTSVAPAANNDNPSNIILS